MDELELAQGFSLGEPSWAKVSKLVTSSSSCILQKNRVRTSTTRSSSARLQPYFCLLILSSSTIYLSSRISSDWISSSKDFFLTSTFPKASLFQHFKSTFSRFSLLAKTKQGVPMNWYESHHCFTISTKPSAFNHIFSYIPLINKKIAQFSKLKIYVPNNGFPWTKKFLAGSK